MNIKAKLEITALVVYSLAIIIYVVVAGIIGGVAVNYLMGVFLGKTLPFIGAILMGLFVGHVAIPIAVIVWVLKAFGLF